MERFQVPSQQLLIPLLVLTIPLFSGVGSEDLSN
jgi:hypothetical protein